MSDLLNITDFLSPINKSIISHDEGFTEGKIGHHINIYEEELPDLDDVDIVLLGCGEERGNANTKPSLSPDIVRAQLYDLYYWHKGIKLADVGNIRIGATLNDTYAALRTVVSELMYAGKTVVIIGGSHDLTQAQYDAYKMLSNLVEISVIDAQIDLDTNNVHKSKHFLMDMFMGSTSFIKHYNHIAFQSYFVNPTMLETLDKLRFDCFRLGVVKGKIDEMEPVLRNSGMVSFDISALQHSAAPSNYLSPNGLNGEEACTLTRYAGMSQDLKSIGFYGYSMENDTQQLTALQMAQMIWYFVDGKWQGKHEAPLAEKDDFNEFNTVFAEVDTVFLQSKKTGRWWMQLPDKTYIACSYQDYLLASSNEIPERWLRAQERG